MPVMAAFCVAGAMAMAKQTAEKPTAETAAMIRSLMLEMLSM